MSLIAADGSSLVPHIWPYVNLGEVPPDRMERLEQVLGTLDDELFPGGIIPRLLTGEMVYYAAAPTAKEWRQLVPLLKASVGPTITNFTGPLVLFDDSDPFEAVLVEHGYQQGARFTAGKDIKRGKYALYSLARLRSLVAGSQISPATQPRATGEVLRDLELALAALDRRSAEEALDFLRVNLRLDAINLASLTIRLHARFKEWEQIRKLDEFSTLSQTRRTPKVTNAMAEAIYRTHFSKYEITDSPKQATSVFREEILPEMGNLFDLCPMWATPAAGKAFLIAAGAATPPNQRRADKLRAMTSEWPEHDVKEFTAIYENCFPTDAASSESRSPLSIGIQGDLSDPQTWIVVPSVEQARARLLAAAEINTLEAFQTVVRNVEAMPLDEKRDLLKNQFHRGIYEKMTDFAGGQIAPKDWSDCINSLAESPQTFSHEFADFAGNEWRVGDQLRRKSDVQRLITSIQTAPAQAQDRLFDTLPHLVQWLQDDVNWPEGRLLALYRAVYDHLLINLSDGWRREAVGAARELLDGILTLGSSEATYTQMLDDLRDVLPKEAGRGDVEVLMELAELTVVHSSSNPEARQKLWARIVAALYPIRTVMSKRELVLVNDLGLVFHIDKVFDLPVKPLEGPSSPSTLDGKTVAIYTLTESVAHRASRLLRELHPGIRVEASHDHGGTARLRTLARSADVFVVCWRSATHSATEFIYQNRPSDQITLYPPGKGSASILRIIDEHLSSPEA